MAAFWKSLSLAMVSVQLLQVSGNARMRLKVSEDLQQGEEEHLEAAGKLISGGLEGQLPSGCTITVVAGANDNVDPFLRPLQEQQRLTVVLRFEEDLVPKGGVSPVSALQGLLQEKNGRWTCNAIVLYAPSRNQADQIARLLEEAEFFLYPEVYLMWVGLSHLVHRILTYSILRNTIYALYLGLQLKDQPLELHLESQSLVLDALHSPEVRGVVPIVQSRTVPRDLYHGFRFKRSARRPGTGAGVVVQVYGRCLFCHEGEVEVQRLDEWSPKTGFTRGVPVFFNQFGDFHGYQMKIVTMPWFPLIALELDPEDPFGPAKPLDSLDFRMLSSIARNLNFTYQYRKPADNQWGQSTDTGNWTGIVGELQYHFGDMSMMLSWMEKRLPIVSYSRIYTSEPLVMLTSRAKPLPQWLALVRPFKGDMWMSIIVSVLGAGLVLWVLQKVYHGLSGDPRSMSIEGALLATWAILLEDPPTRQPKNISGQMMIGWWWVYCMLVTIVYKSALTAHLTIPGKSPTIDTFEQLLKQDGWTWGFEPTYGSGWEFLKTNGNPVVRKIFDKILVLEFDEQLRRLLEENHAFITWKYYSRFFIASQYTNALGYTPIYTARQEYFNYGGYGWGFRKGAPFRKQIDRQKQHLIETGHITFWLDDLINTSARRERLQREKENKGTSSEGATIRLVSPVFSAAKLLRAETEANTVVLSVHHLQGCFYFLFLGYGLALTALVGEKMFQACARSNELVEAKQVWQGKYMFPTAIGVIDCTHIGIPKPKLHGDEYINRKGRSTLNVQATCNAKEMFTSVDVSWPGSVHDLRIWRNSQVCLQLRTKRNVVLLGDDRYGIEPCLMTPFRNPTSPAEVKYNKLFKKERVIIERCFGQLKRNSKLMYGKQGHHIRNLTSYDTFKHVTM
ncbi:uncharacterized protein LOC143030050 [Oratosquilla oratoria]|uniref:uncharacterized protein LOC143030050 n=1 Tax=Oratosquilla oratoria TaxID=337810 RepID=UPI003F759FB8